MAGETWTPFGLSDDEVAEYDVLVPGVPEWLLEPLIGWLGEYMIDGSWLRTDRALKAQIATRINLGAVAGGLLPASNFRETLRGMDDELLLRLVDYVMSVWPAGPRTLAGVRLESTLLQARSKWSVGVRLDRPGLVERVPEGVQDAVEGAIATGGAAGKILARAWASVHGIEPNDSGAYADAVRAAEIAGIAVVQPAHGKATLGTVLGQMRADGDWRLPLREHPDTGGPELVLAMIQTLWYGHRDRHGSVDYSDVTHEEARTAVMVAASLVDWFTSGALARRDAAQS